MQSKRTHMNDMASQQPYVPSAVTASRSQHPPPQGPPFFGGYPARYPPHSSYNESLRPQHYASYVPPPPRQPPYSAPERDEREPPRYDRSSMPPPPVSSMGYQRRRPSSNQEHYPHHAAAFSAGGPSRPPPPPPPPPPPSLESRFDIRDRKSNLPVNGVSQGDHYSSQTDHYRSYGTPHYAIPRSRSWGNGGEVSKHYPEGYHAATSGPYTSAQRPIGKEAEKSVTKEEGGVAGYQIIGNPASPVGPAKNFVYTLPVPQTPSMPNTNKAAVAKPNQKAVSSYDGNAMIYNVKIDSRDGSLSPSEIESSRRDDVSNMGCTCKKSKCLKLYCVCFGASVMCGINCRCLICHNTPVHEQARKDAIRCILARNPHAFDTKFKKAAAADMQTTTTIATKKSLAHKLGCKCRKSFCTKKYCECYNAGVKCSGSCRCINCKNMPPGGFKSTNREEESIVVLPKSFTKDIIQAKKEDNKTPSSENNMMDAAQNLAFLKHASPVAKRSRSDGANSSLPSLVSSSSGTIATYSSDEESSKRRSSLATGGVNTLLMAAYAMTELNEDETLLTPEKSRNVASFHSLKRKSPDGSPSGIIDDQFADADDNDEQVSARIRTPNSNERALKRSRVEANGVNHFEKKTGNNDARTNQAFKMKNNISIDSYTEGGDVRSEGGSGYNDLNGTSPTYDGVMKKFTALSSVSARCLDFQHLRIEKQYDEKKESCGYAEV